MNRCEYYLENLSYYLDGEMSESEMKDIEEHLKVCDSCAREFNILKTIVSTCSELEEELPDGFGSSLHTRLEKAREDMLAARNRTGKIKLFTQIAAGFVIVVTLGFAIRSGFFGNRLLSGNGTTSEVVPMALSPSTTQFSDLKIFGNKDIEKEEAAKKGAATEENFAIAQSSEGSDGVQVQNDSRVILQFDDAVSKSIGESEDDTEITIVVDDIDKAIESILAIDEKVEKSSKGMAYLQESAPAIRGSARNNFVELKLVYTSEEYRQSFLDEMRSAFTDIQVEFIPSGDEKEQEDEQKRIRIIIEKKK